MNIMFNFVKETLCLSLFPHAPPPPNPREGRHFLPSKWWPVILSFAAATFFESHNRALTASSDPKT